MWESQMQLTINNTTVFLVIILEIVLLKDRTNLLKKIMAATIATAGVSLIGTN